MKEKLLTSFSYLIFSLGSNIKQNVLKDFYNTSQPTITCSKLTIEKLEQKLTIKPPKGRHWRRFGGFIANFEHTSRLFFSVSIVNFEQVNARCVRG